MERLQEEELKKNKGKKKAVKKGPLMETVVLE
jgi:hypothetical protein